MLIFACSLVHAIHHELLSGQYMERYIKYIKRFTRLTGNSLNQHADNAKMFSAEENFVL